MLDELLGRAALKDHIDELEEEKANLQRRLDAESDRRAEAVSARQAAEERVNRLEDRIVELEDRVERLQDAEPDLDYRGVETIRGERLDDVLARLRSVETASDGALTAMVEDDSSLPDSVRDAFGEHATLIRRAAPCLVVTDDAGLVSAALTPPAPPEAFFTWDAGFRVDREWFQPTGEFAFALVRSDLFAMGEYVGGERRSTTTLESDVKGKHSKGGFSQGRFERRRDDQIDAHLDRCRETLDSREADRLILVGERTVLSELRDLADWTGTVDASGDPAEALDDAFRSFWTTRLYQI